MSTIPVFIPYVNRLDLLQKAVASVPRQLTPEPLVINNSDSPLTVPCRIVIPSVPLTFAQTQNFMLKISMDRHVPFYLFMHSDAEAVGDTVQRLVAMAKAFTIQNRKWGVIFTNYDALAAFNTAAFRKVGGWDTMLSWYLSDCDMYRRLRLAGYELLESNLPVRHEPSQTINADPAIKRNVEMEVPFRQAYYRTKWGGPNEHEIFDVPWGGK